MYKKATKSKVVGKEILLDAAESNLIQFYQKMLMFVDPLV